MSNTSTCSFCFMLFFDSHGYYIWQKSGNVVHCNHMKHALKEYTLLAEEFIQGRKEACGRIGKCIISASFCPRLLLCHSQSCCHQRLGKRGMHSGNHWKKAFISLVASQPRHLLLRTGCIRHWMLATVFGTKLAYDLCHREWKN